MNTAIATRIAAGVTGAYVHELTRRPAPTSSRRDPHACRPSDMSSAAYRYERPGSGGFENLRTTVRSVS